jgi:predicted RNA-binding Zn ribbon-like protein
VTPAPAPDFTFIRGALALDFVGTVGQRASAHPLERLPDAAALQRWLVDAGLAPPDAPQPDQAVYRSALQLREAIARTGYALVSGAPPARADVALINQAAASSTGAIPYLDERDLTQRWLTADPLQAALANIAADAIRVFATERAHLTRCALDGCGALLLSRARSEPRRWCSMATCGNRAKVASFRARARSQQT